MSSLFGELFYQLRYGMPIWLVFLLCAWLPDISISTRLRGFLVSLFLPGRPKSLTLGRDVTLLSVHKLILGRSVYLAKGVWVNALGGVTLEDEVVVAPYVVISSTNHGFKNNSVKKGGAHPAEVYIGNGTWIASHSVVTAGVKIGKGNIIAANAVVTKNTEDNCIYAGVPAVKIKDRFDNPSSITSKHHLWII